MCAKIDNTYLIVLQNFFMHPGQDIGNTVTASDPLPEPSTGGEHDTKPASCLDQKCSCELMDGQTEHGLARSEVGPSHLCHDPDPYPDYLGFSYDVDYPPDFFED